MARGLSQDPNTVLRHSTICSRLATFSTVSIMPGMETGAEDLTETISPSSKSRPRDSPSQARASSISSMGSVLLLWYSLKASMETTNPGGTGSPSLVMVTRLAPLFPRRALSSHSSMKR